MEEYQMENFNHQAQEEQIMVVEEVNVEETPVKATLKTFEVEIEGESGYFKTDATEFAIEQAINFVKHGEPTVEKLLVAIRMLGHKATPIALNVTKKFTI